MIDFTFCIPRKRFQHHEHKRALFIAHKPPRPLIASRGGKGIQWSIIHPLRIRRKFHENIPAIRLPRLRPLLHNPPIVVRTIRSQPLAPVSIIRIHIHSVSPPVVNQFVIEIPRSQRPRRHGNHPRIQQRKPGKRKAGTEKILHNGKSAIRKATQQRRI